MDIYKVDDSQRFPITKPHFCNNKPRFPYRDVRHYKNPCCDFPKQCQLGFTAQATMEEHHSLISENQSAEHATSQENL